MPAINLLPTWRSSASRSLLRRCGALAVLTLAMTMPASAQRPLRRLGDRLRETIQNVQRVPSSVPRAPAPLPPNPGAGPGALRVPPSALPPTPTERAALPARSNYNAPQSSLRPAVAPTPRAATPYGMQAPASQASAAAPLPSSAAASSSGPATSQPRLGITVESPPLRLSPGSATRAARGAVIVSVHPASSAEAAGLAVGDRIVAVDGRLVEGVEDLVSLLGSLSEGERMDIRYIRDEKLAQTTAVIGSTRTVPNAGRDVAGSPAVIRNGQDAANDNGSSVLSSDEEASELPAPAAGNASDLPTSSGPAGASGMQNLGRMLGGWLGGAASNADAVDAEVADDPDNFEPLSAQQTDPPSLHGESLDSIEPAARSVQEPQDDMETLPPPITPGASGSQSPATDASTAVPRRTGGSEIDPFATGFAEDTVPAEPSPTVQDQESIPPQRSTAAAEQDTVRLLLEEIENLRLRVKQLESDRPAAAD